MGANDVVKHDLTKSSAMSNWIEVAEPLPIPVVRGARREKSARVKAANPPTTTSVSKEEIKTAPYRSVGKMGIRWTGNILGASGWVVAPNAFITAGHCVYDADKGGWITEARFVPHLYTGNEREFIVTTVYTLKGWIETSNSGTQEDYQYDMAACVISQGFDLESSPPLSFDIGPAGQYSAIGYPSTPMPGYNFNGVEMWKSIGNRTSSGPYPVDGLWWAENNLTGGASGGPWCEPGNNYVVSGINSFRLYDPNEMASPALEQGFQNLYDAVKNL